MKLPLPDRSPGKSGAVAAHPRRADRLVAWLRSPSLRLPYATRLVALVAALSDGDAIGEILDAAGTIAGTALDFDAAEHAT
jgi:hypothetical protein